jgi:hypothetical protein
MQQPIMTRRAAERAGAGHVLLIGTAGDRASEVRRWGV